MMNELKYHTPPNPNSNRQARLRKRACEQKTRMTQAVAERVAEQIRQSPSHVRNKWVVAYKCQHCEGWHIGHQKRSW